MKVEEGEARSISDVHWIGRSRFAKIAGRDPIRGYDGGSLPELVEVDIIGNSSCVVEESLN